MGSLLLAVRASVKTTEVVLEITLLTVSEQTYTKHSTPALKVDSHFTVIEATLKGYVKWRRYHGRDHVGFSTRWNPILTATKRKLS